MKELPSASGAEHREPSRHSDLGFTRNTACGKGKLGRSGLRDAAVAHKAPTLKYTDGSRWRIDHPVRTYAVAKCNESMIGRQNKSADTGTGKASDHSGE